MNSGMYIIDNEMFDELINNKCKIKNIDSDGTYFISDYIGQYFPEICRFYKTGELCLEARLKYQIIEILDEAKFLKYDKLIEYIESNTKTSKTKTIKKEKLADESKEPKVKKTRKNEIKYELDMYSVSPELAKLLKLDSNYKGHKVEINKLINKYIVDNNLQSEDEKIYIIPNAKFKKLLTLDKNEKLTFFNLNDALSSHIIKINHSPE
jgi:chromatin remodeling complex protein RSC6